MRRMKTYQSITPLAGLSECLLTASKHSVYALSHSRKQQFRAGMTLVELLVVTVLLSILVSTAIPVISPNNDSRKIREASRAINAYLAAAQAKAIETGRPYGVEFTRLSDTTGSGEDNGACTQLTQIEVPPHYTGIDSNSVARITANFTIFRTTGTRILDPDEPYTLQFLRRNDLASDTAVLPGYSTDLFPPSMIRPNDILEFKGQRFYILSKDTDAQGYCNANATNVIKQIGLRPVQYHVSDKFPDGTDKNEPDATDAVNWKPIDDNPSHNNLIGYVNRVLPYIEETQLDNYERNVFDSYDSIDRDSQAFGFWTEPASFRIERQPTPTSAEPLQLPAGMAIDLNATGVDLGQEDGCRFYNPAGTWDGSSREFNVLPTSQSPRLIFTPSGQTLVRMPGADPKLVTGSLSICVGRVELVSYELYDIDSPGINIQNWGEPIDLNSVYFNSDLSEEETREITDQYNWLNMDSRWVMVSGRSGSIVTVPNNYISPSIVRERTNRQDINSFRIDEQFRAALQNAPTRITAGGR